MSQTRKQKTKERHYDQCSDGKHLSIRPSQMRIVEITQHRIIQGYSWDHLRQEQYSSSYIDRSYAVGHESQRPPRLAHGGNWPQL